MAGYVHIKTKQENTVDVLVVDVVAGYVRIKTKQENTVDVLVVDVVAGYVRAAESSVVCRVPAAHAREAGQGGLV